MDELRRAIRCLQVLLANKTTVKENLEIRAELRLLEEEHARMEEERKDMMNGISKYGSYFSN